MTTAMRDRPETVLLRENSGVRRTLITFAGAALGVLPLCELFTDRGWLPEVWFTMLVVLLPAIVLRVRSQPGPLQIWPGVLLLVPWLTARFVPEHAFLGLVPTRSTGADVSALMDDLHATIHAQTAPVASSAATGLALCALAGLLMALLDLLVVVGRRAALAGVPLLVIFSASGAVRRHPVSWVWFVAAAVGFLLLLSSDADERLAGWGQRVRQRRTARGGHRWARSGQRIALLAVAASVLLPLLLPVQSTKVLGGWLRGGSGNGGDAGFGIGGGNGSIAPFAALKGQLELSSPVDLFTVHISDADPGVRPYFLRTNVLSRFTGSGWVAGSFGDSEPLRLTGFGTEPQGSDIGAQGFRAHFEINGLSGNPPIFARPVRMRGELGSSAWSPTDQLIVGSKVQKGQTYDETVLQPQPGLAGLHIAPDDVPPQLSSMLAVPRLPKPVTDLVSRLVARADGPYARARAISDYFTDPANGFRYSLATKVGDSGSDLVDFLQNKTGFCQQYAGAMAVMLRVAGVPARVVLGYAHQGLNASGTLSVTTRDAHAWVEGYFSGIGWVPFNPTPVIGTPGGAANELPWAPHGNDPAQPSGTPGASRTAPTASPHGPRSAVPTPGTDRSPAGTATQDLLPLLVAALVALAVVGLALCPYAVRTARRQRRLRAGDPDALWAELSDTAVDLGYVWSPARTPRQVARWLDGQAGPASQALQGLAVAVERARYAPPGAVPAPADLRDDLDAVRTELRRGRGSGARVRAVLWPASLRWSLGRGWRELTGRLRRRH